MTQRLTILVFCALVAYLGLFYKLGNLPFIGADEPRYARIAEEMWLSGDLVTPTLLGRPWLEKTPLLFWLESASFAGFGVSEWSARLPNSLLGLLGAIVAAFFIAGIDETRTGVLSYLILLTSTFYLLFARTASTDAPLVTTLTTALVFGFLAERSASILWPVLSGATLALAVLAKGPLAAFLFLAIFAVYYLVTGAIGWRPIQALVGVFSFLCLAVPWFCVVWLQNGSDFVMTFWINHHLARFATDLHHHSQPIWFYVPILLVGFFPWVFFLGSSIQQLWREREDLSDSKTQCSVFLWSWALVPFVFFSLSDAKLPGYILLIIPPLALLAGLEWNRHLRGELTTFVPMRIQLALMGAFSLILALALVLGFHFRYRAPDVGLVISLPLVGATILGRWEFRHRRPARLFVTLVAGISLTLALLFWRAVPLVGAFHSTAGLCNRSMPLISGEEPLILYRFFHHSARYYCDYMTTRDSVNNPEELREYVLQNPQSRYLLLAKEGAWQELKRVAQATLVEQEGDFFLVELSSDPADWNLEKPSQLD